MLIAAPLHGDDPKPTTEGGVSIKLKLLPENKSESTEAAKEETKPGVEADEKQTGKKSEAKAETKPETKTDVKSEAKLEDKPELKPELKPEAKSVAKTEKPTTGTVELKLLPPIPTEESTSKDKTSGSVSMTLQPPKADGANTNPEMPKGTVEVSLQPSKENSAASGNGKVTIELVQLPARKIISDNGNQEATGMQTFELNGESVDASANASTASTPLSDKSAKSKANRGGDPGDPGDGEAEPLKPQPGDIPLEQDSLPEDVPAAKATEGKSRFRGDSATPSPEGSVADRERKRRIEAVLDFFRTHPENVVRRGPWAIMHAILPYGVETEIIAGKRKVNAIGWLCHNGVSAKQRMFQPTQTGFRTNVGPGVQGHEGQFLAILAQSHVQVDYPIQIGNRKYTIRDLIKYEMATCREKSELTFKLIGFSHYLEPQQTWRDNRGRPWSIEKIVAEELAQPINGQACGGTHRLMGLTCAVVSRQEAGLPITGHFDRAQRFLNDFVDYTMTLQNADGSFSTEWFERRAEEPNVERKVQTTGHILEWLVYTLPDEHLKTPEIEKAVDFLLNSIGNNPSRDWPIGPRGHSLRALSLYHQRAYKGQEPATRSNAAAQSGDRAIQR